MSNQAAETARDRALRLSHYVCCTVGEASGIYRLTPTARTDGAPRSERLPLPPLPCTPRRYVGKELAAKYGECIDTILDAAVAAYITWEQACAAAEHVDQFALQRFVHDAVGQELELTQCVAWERTVLNPGEPPVLNLHMRAAPVVNLGDTPVARVPSFETRQTLYEKQHDVHLVVAQCSRVPITQGEVVGAFDVFEQAAGELEAE